MSLPTTSSSLSSSSSTELQEISPSNFEIIGLIYFGEFVSHPFRQKVEIQQNSKTCILYHLYSCIVQETTRYLYQTELFLNVDRDFAIMVFGIGLIVISVFSFALSIAFIVYWVKLHRMVRSIKLASSIQSNPNSVSPFLRRVGIMAIIFILCLDIKIVHYFVNIDSPFQSSIWDLYALNYLPEAIAVTVALVFFASSYVRNDSSSNTSSNTSSNSTAVNSSSMSETERANHKRREEKIALLN
ncbi:hypothetical protein DFA_01634 [Cavenderia fasciculata]|uniref:THH1/TOM1/TOM3 domain-containing protein n=1 Tax=Cavenderia fasciculata TaxID=261658 RepID=F4PTY0_CACFS|nr:uncharacterized protein DFA_01634 [Cavenderia fasciculata]EGG21748.1 hypothetical protein DFA_01634 [Cavenderia fasciculata]|eukprot:XP_004359598.1 hypothetical protein DFA_01634 [Cavenderia fasciculata]